MNKMIRILAVLVLLCGVSFGQSLLRVQKFCEVGNQSVVTQGLNSVTKVQRSFPQCLVTVYQSGTTNKAAIYSDNLSIPTQLANPFTANVDGSWGFYASTGACYDVVTSGGGIPSPFTYSYICLSTGGSGSAPCPSTVVNGAIRYSNGSGGFNCDNSFITDGSGNWISQSGKTIGPFNGFFGIIGGGTSPGSAAKFKLGANEFRFLGNTLVTPYYLCPPPTIGSLGQVWGLATQTTDGNGDIVDCMQWQDPVHVTAVAFSALPTCNAGAEGTMRAVTDSTTATWGATIAGSSTNHVLAYCDGTNWTVMGK